jgi:dipeptidyl-peptidase-4
MLYRLFLAALFLCCFSAVDAQNKSITLESIWDGTFRTQGMQSLHSMNNGQQYAVLNFNRSAGTSSIDLYDYKTLEKVETVLNSTNLDDISYFIDYQFSADESKILLTTSQTPIFRRSTVGTYYVYNRADRSLTQVSDNSIQEPTFSPDASKVAYGFENNLYVKDLTNGNTEQLTFDGAQNKIINGITDWVYEEEFGFVRAFDWNADGTKLAFIRFDETEVPEFSMDVYGNELYPTQDVFKYPKAGEKNAEVSLYIYDLNKNTTSKVEVNKPYADFYIPRIKWSNDAAILSAQYINRHQNELDLWMINADGMTSNLVLEERDEAYVDVTSDLTFLSDHSFIWTSERDGFNHIYHYDKTGKLINQITKGNWEVTNYYGYDAKTKRIFYQSVENGSINRDVYAIGLNGKNKQRLTNLTGTNSASFSADFSYFINTFSNATTPPVYTLHDSKKGTLLKTIVDNASLVNKLKEYQISTKEFSTIQVNGNELNMYMIKPLDFDASKSYPLFMFQYSGPGSQQVANRWNGANDYWHQMLAQQGVIIACVDGRGTGLKGAAFKKVTQKELGKYEVEDQIEAARQLGTLPYVDANRIGIWGWSYGGFMSSNALFQGSDVFKMAIAVAPVTSWRFYDTIYTERYMTTPQANPEGYDDNSPLTHAGDIKGRLLIVHGSADDNVHAQNTYEFTEKLVQEGIQFDMAIYTNRAHGISGGNTTMHLYTKMTNFFMDHLK